jgi:phage baseplate assembly protein W|tara:strand:+ start:545 stop:925 length:381 start_codon:yes stop_codon:yes gene_type:complete
MSNYSPVLPLTIDPTNGMANNQSIISVVMQNLKMLILTAPGERIMDPTFGVGMRNYLFEQNTESTHSKIRAKIHRQVQEYMSFLTITDIIFNTESSNSNIRSNAVSITINFFISATAEAGTLGITI